MDVTTTHLDLDQLLDLRDGVAAPAAAAHVDACAGCATELERLRAVTTALQAMPPVAPPPTLYARVRATQRRRVWRRRVAPAGALALAASILMGVTLTWEQRPDEAPVLTHTDSELTQLYAHARDLEAMLGALDANAGVLDLDTAGTIVALEDRIAAVERHLTTDSTLEPPMAQALWRQRVELMEALVSVHVAHAQPALFEQTY
jgi:hypothetical protein